MFWLVHWIPKFVLTFRFKKLTGVLTGSRPSSHHSKTRNTAHLLSTKDVPFHTPHAFLYLQCDSDDFLSASFLLLFFSKIIQGYWPEHVHLVITQKLEIWRYSAVLKTFHFILFAVFLLTALFGHLFVCFFYENFHHFSFPPFSVKSESWESFSWGKLFSVSIKVCLKPSSINKSYRCADLRVFC